MSQARATVRAGALRRAATFVAAMLGFGVASASQRDGRSVTQSFDAARNTADNRRNWEFADSSSADAAASPEVRAKLRDRGRYEEGNNPFLFGQARSLGNDVVGPSGPTLQLKTDNQKVNRAVERRWREWAREVGLAAKLRLMRRTRAVQGEVFARLIYNPALPTAVKLDLQVLEADMVTTPTLTPVERENWVDGIEFDPHGNPTFYHILRRHPGDTSGWNINPLDFERVPAADVLHYFRVERPGQRRGFPEITPALGLYSDRRRFRIATLDAAETQARFAAVLPMAGDADTTDPPPDFEVMDLPRRGMLTLPPGSGEMKQLTPSHPNTTFENFDRGLVTESARTLNQPRNVATGDSSSYNYSSTRADHQEYDRAVDVDRDDLDAPELLRKLLSRFCAELIAVSGDQYEGALIPAAARRLLPTLSEPRKPFAYVWNWKSRGHVDEVKNATAQKMRLEARTTTYAAEYAEVAADWEVEFDQAEVEQEALAGRGLLKHEPISAQAMVASVTVLTALAGGQISPESATAILSAAGIPLPIAKQMVATTPRTPPGASQSEENPLATAPVATDPARNGRGKAAAGAKHASNGNGVGHG